MLLRCQGLLPIGSRRSPALASAYPGDACLPVTTCQPGSSQAGKLSSRSCGCCVSDWALCSQINESGCAHTEALTAHVASLKDGRTWPCLLCLSCSALNFSNPGTLFEGASLHQALGCIAHPTRPHTPLCAYYHHCHRGVVLLGKQPVRLPPCL